MCFSNDMINMHCGTMLITGKSPLNRDTFIDVQGKVCVYCVQYGSAPWRLYSIQNPK